MSALEKRRRQRERERRQQEMERRSRVEAERRSQQLAQRREEPALLRPMPLPRRLPNDAQDVVKKTSSAPKVNFLIDCRVDNREPPPPAAWTAARREVPPTVNFAKATASPAPGKTKKVVSTLNFADTDSSSDENDDTFMSNFFAREKQRMSNLSTKERDGELKPSPVEAAIQATTKSRLKCPVYESESDSDEDDDDACENKETKQTKKLPRNPITNMQNQEFKSLPTVAVSNNNDASLWSDSEQEEEKEEANSNEKGKKKKKKKKRRSTSSDPRAQSSSDTGGVQQLERLEESLVGNMDKAKLQLKPDFPHPVYGPFTFEPLPLGQDGKHTVPASINQYLKNFQREGVDFMYKRTCDPENQGGILGDDMGLGKTIQVVALLAALLEKTGTAADLLELHRRKRRADELLSEMTALQNQANLQGQAWLSNTNDGIAAKVNLPEWAPILIVMPTSILDNWVETFSKWGHFSVAKYHGSGRKKAYDSIKNGLSEVLLCTHSHFMNTGHISSLKQIPWKAVVVDEFHCFKNGEGYLACHLRELRDHCKCAVIGLTGTVMQNDHKELWNLIDLVSKDYFGPWKHFEEEFANPIKLGRTKHSNDAVKQIGEQKSREFSSKLFKLFVRRSKEDELKDDLPNKDERIVFCELSDLQKRLYRHVISLPDFVLLSKMNGPCDCGVNQKFFLEYQRLKTNQDRIDYQREHKDEIVPRYACCYKIPNEVDRADGGDAVLWRQKHPDGCACELRPWCPFCIFFSALHILYKLSSHAALLQLRAPPEQYGVGSKDHTDAINKLERAKIFIPEDELQYLPGGSYVGRYGIMNDHFALSGKMRILHRLLEMIDRKQGRVLLFSASTQMLDLIQNYLKSEGHTHLRVDGSTARTKRSELVAEFKRNNGCFLFLLSTKAMGMGLNLTEANYVIIFDVEWNPSYDAQAQDRAYRIGQKKDVTVYRLVSRGTVEELKYLRQVYKNHLEQETIIDLADESRETAARLFRGVAGDTSRRGELFGLANLLKFKDGNFMKYSSVVCDARKYDVHTHTASALRSAVEAAESGEMIDELGPDAMVFDNAARKKCEDQSESRCDGDQSDDESVLGGESQMVMDICDGVELPPIAEEDSTKEMPKPEECESEVANAGKPPNDEPTKVLRDSDSRSVLLSARALQDREQDAPADKPSPQVVLSKAVRVHFSNGFVPQQPLPATSVAPTVTSANVAAVETISGDVSGHRKAKTTSIIPDASKKRKPERRNVTVCGVPVNKIKGGGSGETTFSLDDLALPSGLKMPSKKKKT